MKFLKLLVLIELERESCPVDVESRPSFQMLEDRVRVETGNSTQHDVPTYITNWCIGF